MATNMEKLKEILAMPGWRDELQPQLEKIQLMEESAADTDERLEICKNLQRLSEMCRRGRKVGFSDEGERMALSAEAAILAFKRSIEICEQLRRTDAMDIRISDQLNRSYYGIADLLLRAGKKAEDPAVGLQLLQESRSHAQTLHDMLQHATAASADMMQKDFALQFIAISDMQLEEIDEYIGKLNAGN